MKDIRKGNDIYFTWRINHLDEVTGDKVIQLHRGNSEQAEVITYQIDGDTVTGTFFGKNQVSTGVYRLLLLCNYGNDNMVTLDKVSAWNLTGVCDFGIVRGEDEDAVETVLVELESTLNVSVGSGEGQVQADWTEENTESPAYIKHKPEIPAEQVQSDWNVTDNESKAFIKNKPTIPAEQVNSDWNATSGKAKILNKPTIPDVSGKVDKVPSATVDHLASFSSGGGIQDSGYKIVTISSSDYEGLTTKDANTIYLVTE